MSFLNVTKILNSKELELFSKELKKVIKININFRLNFIHNGADLLRWSVSKEVKKPNETEILVVNEREYCFLKKFTRYEIIKAPLSVSDFINVLLSFMKGESADCIKESESVRFSYRDLAVMSEMNSSLGSPDKNFRKRRERLRVKFNLKSDYEIVVLSNILISKPTCKINLSFDCDPAEKKASDTFQKIKGKTHYIVMGGINSLRAGPLLNCA